jgi:hypothetical protein
MLELTIPRDRLIADVIARTEAPPAERRLYKVRAIGRK